MVLPLLTPDFFERSDAAWETSLGGASRNLRFRVGADRRVEYGGTLLELALRQGRRFLTWGCSMPVF
jgi:hypothetical protein